MLTVYHMPRDMKSSRIITMCKRTLKFVETARDYVLLNFHPVDSGVYHSIMSTIPGNLVQINKRYNQIK